MADWPINTFIDKLIKKLFFIKPIIHVTYVHTVSEGLFHNTNMHAYCLYHGHAKPRTFVRGERTNQVLAVF